MSYRKFELTSSWSGVRRSIAKVIVLRLRFPGSRRAFLHSAMANPFMYSFSGNSAASVPIFTFMCLCAIYLVPGTVHIFSPAEKADPSWEYIIRSQTHECGNWDRDPDIPFLGIFISNFRHFVFAVHSVAPSSTFLVLHLGLVNRSVFWYLVSRKWVYGQVSLLRALHSQTGYILCQTGGIRSGSPM